MLTVGVLVNRNARRHRRNPGLVRRYQDLGALVVQTGSLDELDDAVVQLCAAGVDRVALSGGDGAVHRGLSAVIRSWTGSLPTIALLPAGTMNTVARGLGVRGGPMRSLRAAMAEHPSTVVRRPIDAGAERFGFLVGTGFWARFLREYDLLSGPGGLRAARVLGTGLVSTVTRGDFVRELFEPIEASVSFDDQRLAERRWTMLAAGVVPGVGLGFSPFAGILDQPDSLHALAFSSSPGRVAQQLPRLYCGGAPTAPDVGRPVRTVRIDSERAFDWAIDGDVQEPVSTLTLTCGPAISFVVP